MFFGVCDECADEGKGWPTGEFFYCAECWEWHDARAYRCCNVCAVYDARDGRRIATGTSIEGCAERNALWKLWDVDDGALVGIPKVLVVARVRSSTNTLGRRRSTYGMSRPCAQCATALVLYNVVRVAYSDATPDERSVEARGAKFVWEDVDDVCAAANKGRDEYYNVKTATGHRDDRRRIESKSAVIVRM